jgi:nicotinic acid mononucleotide adenylyltransferase
MTFTYNSITYQVHSLNGFAIHNDTKFVWVVGSDGSRKVSEWNRVKPFIFDINHPSQTQNNQKE